MIIHKISTMHPNQNKYNLHVVFMEAYTIGRVVCQGTKTINFINMGNGSLKAKSEAK